MLNEERKKSKSCPKLSDSASGEASCKIVVNQGNEDKLSQPKMSSPVTDIKLNASPTECDLCKIPRHQWSEKISLNLADVEDYCTLRVLKKIPKNVIGQKVSLILKEIKPNNVESCTKLPSINLKYVNILKLIDEERYKFDRMSTRNEWKSSLNAVNYQMIANENKKRIHSLIKPPDSELTQMIPISNKKQCDLKCKFPNTDNATNEISINALKAIPDNLINDKNDMNKQLKNDHSAALGSKANGNFLNVSKSDCLLSSSSCSISPKNKRFNRADAFLTLLTSNYDKNVNITEMNDGIIDKFDMDSSQSTDNDFQAINPQSRKNNANDKLEILDSSPQNTTDFLSFPISEVIFKPDVDKNENLLEYLNSKFSSIKCLETGSFNQLDQSTIKLLENPSSLDYKSIFAEDNTFTDQWVPFDWSDRSQNDTCDSISFIDDLFSQDSTSEIENSQKNPISSSNQETKIDKNKINKLLFKVYSKYKKKPIDTVYSDVIKSFKGSLKYCIETDVKSPSIYLSLVLQMILLENTTLFLKKYPFVFCNDFLERVSPGSNEPSALVPAKQELIQVVQEDSYNYCQMVMEMNCYSILHPDELQFYSISIEKHIFSPSFHTNRFDGFSKLYDNCTDSVFDGHMFKCSNTCEVNKHRNLFVLSKEINPDFKDYYEESGESQHILYYSKHELAKQAIFTTEITNYDLIIVKLLKSMKIRNIEKLKSFPRFSKIIKHKSHKILTHDEMHSHVANLHSRIMPNIIVDDGDVQTKIDPSFDISSKSYLPIKRARSFKINREPPLGDRILKWKCEQTQTAKKKWKRMVQFSTHPNKGNEYSHIHVCEICGDSFPMKITLRYHLRNHSTQLSSKCK